MSDSAGRVADAPAVVARLRDAAAAREDAREAVEDVGRERLVALQSALDDAHRLFDRYEERATGTGDFQAYVSFQDDLVDFVEALPKDLPERVVFEGWLDDFKKRTLSTSDFERARDDLADARDLVDRLDTLRDCEEAHRQAIADAKARRSTLRSDIEHLERVLELDEADLDAPIEAIRDPIETANTALEDAFTEFRRTAPARDVLAVFDRAQAFPLVDAPEPPTELRAYLGDHAVGEKSIGRLLELADFSSSKLEHFVDDPAALKRVVVGNRTVLDALSADPFTIDWPPARGDVLRRRADELLSATSRFASEDAAAALRTVQQVAREGRFSSLHAAAIARDELSDADRERLASGAVETDLAAARDDLHALTDALDEYA